MAKTPQRHHWLNTFVGVLYGAFDLTEEEQFAVADIVAKLLTQLRIPDRGTPQVVPIPVAQEVHASLYTLQLDRRRNGNARPITEKDCVASLEAWRSALVDMLTTSYPDLTPEERFLLTKVFTDLLAAIGVPNRAATHFPSAVVHAHRNIDNL